MTRFEAAAGDAPMALFAPPLASVAMLSVPELMDVAPVYELTPDNVSTFAPIFCTVPVPLIVVERVTLSGRSKTTAELLVIVLARFPPPTVTPSPICSVPALTVTTPLAFVPVLAMVSFPVPFLVIGLEPTIAPAPKNV